MEVTAISIVTKEKELLAHIDLLSGEIITSEGIEVMEHTKDEPAIFRETNSSNLT